MEASLNAILSEINTALKAGLSYGDKVTTYGLCEHLEKNGKTVPVLNVGSGQGKIIEWNDKETLRVYHRILDVAEPGEDFGGFGANTSTTLNFPMRMVVIGTRAALTVAGYEDNQEFLRDFSKQLIKSTTTKEIIIKGEHQPLKTVVYEEEYPGVEQKHLTLDGIAFWINYTIVQRVCY